MQKPGLQSARRGSLILASASPRRAELLRQLGLDFRVHSADIDETPLTNELPADYVKRLAVAKGREVSRVIGNGIVLSADTTVSFEKSIFGKPETLDEAMAVWQLLSDRWHEVFTGVAIQNGDMIDAFVVCSRVRFKPLVLSQMKAYWETGEPLGKAGGYAIQGIGAAWITAIEGSYSNIVGLPLYETFERLKILIKSPDV